MQKTCEELSARGVRFLQPPTTELRGASAIFNEPDGNSFVISPTRRREEATRADRLLQNAKQ